MKYFSLGRESFVFVKLCMETELSSKEVQQCPAGVVAVNSNKLLGKMES